jgi:hypothetical protein
VQKQSQQQQEQVSAVMLLSQQPQARMHMARARMAFQATTAAAAAAAAEGPSSMQAMIQVLCSYWLQKKRHMSVPLTGLRPPCTTAAAAYKIKA